jgi:hypothetical protein
MVNILLQSARNNVALEPLRFFVSLRRRRVDFASVALRSGAGPRGPNAARALCEESLHDCYYSGYQTCSSFFSSGPCAKPPTFSPEKLATASLGRSHRAKIGKARLQYSIDLMRELLGLPDTHRIGIVPGSDTGAFEMAMWTMLGAREVTALAWESFGEGWVTDAVKQLKLDATVVRADYGQLPDLDKVDWSNDVLFTWNGTTSGVRARRRMDPRRPRGPELRRRHQRCFRLRHRLDQDRRRHLLLAEGAGR